MDCYKHVHKVQKYLYKHLMPGMLAQTASIRIKCYFTISSQLLLNEKVQVLNNSMFIWIFCKIFNIKLILTDDLSQKITNNVGFIFLQRLSQSTVSGFGFNPIKYNVWRWWNMQSGFHEQQQTHTNNQNPANTWLSQYNIPGNKRISQYNI